MIRVCDAIMGAGKSQSTITYINEHPTQKFIYITPYLEEAARIAQGCPSMNFQEPKRLDRYNGSKLLHTQALVTSGCNIATTHQAFKNYTEETLNAVREKGYTLIIDESVNVLEECDIDPADLQLVVDAGYVKFEDDSYTLVRTDYSGKLFKEMFWLLKSRQITKVDCPGASSGGKLYYWVLPKELIMAFKDVFILTYMFEGQSLHSFLKIHDLPYEYIGIERTETGNGFRFCEAPGYTPEYVSHIKDMIEIVDKPKLNAIGDSRTALSMSWFETNKETGVRDLKNNIGNVFKHVWNDAEAGARMWSTFKKQHEALKGKGYTNAYTIFNMRASNVYRNRRYLVYACNIFMNVSEKIFYQKYGVVVDEGAYALSIMIQWIWRSAIRDGEKIYIYIPSRRMRELLIDWMNSLEKGGHENEQTAVQ